jgi:hypothetical protein
MAQPQNTWAHKSSITNRALPAVPHDVGEDDDSDSEATPPPSSPGGPSASTSTMTSSAPLLLGPSSRRQPRQSQRRTQVEGDAEASEPRARSYVPTFVPVLPNPFNAEETDARPRTQRARAAIQIQTETRTPQQLPRSPEEERRSDDGPYSPSFMSSPTTAHLHRSLTFTSARTDGLAASLSSFPSSPTSTHSASTIQNSSRATSSMVPLTLSFANDRDHYQYEPSPPPSPSQWLSRSPGGSTRTMLEGMVEYQKQLEADAHDATGGGSKPDPPPKYSAEEPSSA